MRSNKYHNKKIQTPDGDFDSKKEYMRWVKLKRLAEVGNIEHLQRQVPFELIPSQELRIPRLMKKSRSHRMQRREQPVKYIADFTYTKDGELIVEDTKGMKTPEYIIKRKLMKWVHDIEILEV